MAEKKVEKKVEEKFERPIQYCPNHPDEQIDYGLVIDKKVKVQKLMCEVC